MKKQKLDKNLIYLLITSGLHNILGIYMGTFVIAYILNTSSGNFFNVAIYYVVSYLVMIVFYTLFSFLANVVKKTRLTQIATICFALILVYMTFFGHDISKNVIPIAIFYNLANALYYSSLNALSNEIIKGKFLQSHSTYASIIGSITSIVIPIIFGTMIDLATLQSVSIVVMLVCFGEIVLMFLIDEEKHAPKRLNFKGYYTECYNGTHKRCFNLLFLGYIGYGAKDGIATLVTMLIVLAFKTNFSLGAISSLISILTIILLMVTNRKNITDGGPLYLTLSLITIISMLVLIINLSPVTIIIFNICYSSILAIVNRSYAVKRSGIIRAIDKKEYIVEHQAVNELFLNIGRTIFYLILLLASFSNEIWVYQMLIAVAIAFIFLYGIFAYLLEKEYKKILIEKEFKKQVMAQQGNNDYQLIPSYSNPSAHH